MEGAGVLQQEAGRGARAASPGHSTGRCWRESLTFSKSRAVSSGEVPEFVFLEQPRASLSQSPAIHSESGGSKKDVGLY